MYEFVLEIKQDITLSSDNYVCKVLNSKASLNTADLIDTSDIINLSKNNSTDFNQ